MSYEEQVSEKGSQAARYLALNFKRGSYWVKKYLL
jgi:hypothetical protein